MHSALSVDDSGGGWWWEGLKLWQVLSINCRQTLTKWPQRWKETWWFYYVTTADGTGRKRYSWFWTTCPLMLFSSIIMVAISIGTLTHHASHFIFQPLPLWLWQPRALHCGWCNRNLTPLLTDVVVWVPPAAHTQATTRLILALNVPLFSSLRVNLCCHMVCRERLTITDWRRKHTITVTASWKRSRCRFKTKSGSDDVELYLFFEFLNKRLFLALGWITLKIFRLNAFFPEESNGREAEWYLAVLISVRGGIRQRLSVITSSLTPVCIIWPFSA